MKKIGLDEPKEEDVDSLLQTIGEELENQRRQLEEEVQAEQQPPAPLTMKHLTVNILHRFYAKLSNAMNYLEEVNLNVESAGLARRKVLSDLALYDQMLYEKKREASQAALDVFFSKVSLPESSANDEPQPITSTGGFICTNIPSPPSSDIDDPDVI